MMVVALPMMHDIQGKEAREEGKGTRLPVTKGFLQLMCWQYGISTPKGYAD
jgi:hypothetical protein